MSPQQIQLKNDNSHLVVRPTPLSVLGPFRFKKKLKSVVAPPFSPALLNYSLSNLLSSLCN